MSFGFNGITSGMQDLSRLSNARTRSISPENYTGAVGGGARCEGVRHVSLPLGAGGR